MSSIQQLPILAASICLRRGSEVLLIKRAKEPGKGKWAFPGGKVSWGETTSQAALRELQEEAGIAAQIGPLIGLYEVIYPQIHFAIACYFGSAPSGEVRAGSDADDACWFDVADIFSVPLASNIAEVVVASGKFMQDFDKVYQPR